ncbi:MAG: response regulator [Rhizomicrobium sp.]
MSEPSTSCVLVVEDEWLIAATLEDMLRELGYQVRGPAARVTEALELLDGQPVDVAVLDITLHAENSFPIARALKDRGVPFVFLTGYVCNDIPDEFRDAPMLNKPTEQARLAACLRELLARRARGKGDGRWNRRAEPAGPADKRPPAAGNMGR